MWAINFFVLMFTALVISALHNSKRKYHDNNLVTHTFRQPDRGLPVTCTILSPINSSLFDLGLTSLSTIVQS